MFNIYCIHFHPNIYVTKAQSNTPQALKGGINIYQFLEYANNAKQAPETPESRFTFELYVCKCLQNNIWMPLL